MKKKPLQKAFSELNAAHRSLIEMKRASKFEAIEEKWENFLQNLDRIWGKVQAEHKTNNEFYKWNEKYKSEREIDELLVYLNRVRNATEHSIQDTLNHQK